MPGFVVCGLGERIKPTLFILGPSHSTGIYAIHQKNCASVDIVNYFVPHMKRYSAHALTDLDHSHRTKFNQIHAARPSACIQGPYSVVRKRTAEKSMPKHPFGCDAINCWHRDMSIFSCCVRHSASQPGHGPMGCGCGRLISTRIVHTRSVLASASDAHLQRLNGN